MTNTKGSTISDNMETELTKAWRSGNIEALEALGCKVSKGGGSGLSADQPRETQKCSQHPRPLLEPGIAIVQGTLTLFVAVETKNETNERQWKAKSRRAGAQWNAVRKAVGPHLVMLVPLAEHLAQGGAVRARFTRLGGRHLDQLANLGAAFKGVEDAVCFLLGIDDRSPQWHPVAEQEPGSGPVGVRVEIEEWR